MKVLVLDAHSVAGLSVVRSLGRRGVETEAAGEEGSFALAARSRYAQSFLSYPAPGRAPAAFVAWIAGILRSRNYAYVIPVTDRTIVPLHLWGRELPGAGAVVLPGQDSLERTLDKELTLKAAGELGIPFPATSVWGRDGFREPGPFPLVVKSRFSRTEEGGNIVADPGPVFVQDREELEAACRARHSLIPHPLVQEKIEGTGYGYFVLARRGEVLLSFAHRRVREEDPRGSRSSCCVSIAPPERLADSAQRLIRGLDWTGVAMVEFKQDGRDGDFKLMEVNGRFWGSLPLALAAGVDFPFALLEMLEGHAVRQPDYRSGIKARYIYADFQHLLNVFFGPPPAWTAAFPGRWRSLKDVGTDLFLPGVSGFTLVRDDPRPGLAENGRFLAFELPRRIFGGLKKKMKKGIKSLP